MRHLFRFLILVVLPVSASLYFFTPYIDEALTTEEFPQKSMGLAEKAALTPMGNDNVDTKAEAAVLLDGDTGDVLWQKNGNKALPPASMSKVMSMYVILEAMENGDLATDDEVAISDGAANTGGASVYLQEGAVLPAGDLFEAMTIVSANDASVALAEHTAGSEEAFIERMNAKAREIGMSQDAHFINASGLPHETFNYESRMSALDTATLSYHLLHDYPDIINLTKQPTLSLSYKSQILPNTNELLQSEEVTGSTNDQEMDTENLPNMLDIDGLKTGYTRQAGYSFIGTSEQHGKRLIAVVMRTDSAEARFEETEKLLQAGFDFVQTDLRAERE